MAYNSPISRSSFDRLIASRAQSETTAGELWTIKQDGEDWPLVVCDEEMVQKYYVGKQRPLNSRQPDGTWADGYKTGEHIVGQRCYPTLVLGKYKLTWTPWKMLEPLDQDIGQVICSSTTNPLLAEAWREALQYQGKGDALSYFKDRLRQKWSERLKSKAFTSAAPEKRKRRGTPKFNYPLGYGKDNVDDEESSDLFIQGENNSTPRIKQEYSDITFPAEVEALYEDTAITTPPGLVSKRSKTDVAGHFSVRPGTSFRSGTIDSFGGGMRQSVSRTTLNVEAKKNTINDPNRVMIYVDNPHQKFRVKRSGLDASPLLKNLIAHNPEIGWYVMSPLLSTLNEDDFLPIAQYLERGEYDPNILDEGTEYVRLAIELTPAERGEEVVRCATIYSIAQMLELPGLQNLAFRKLKAIAKGEPHHPFAILCVVEFVFEKADQDLRQYLVQYLADHYWDLVLAETMKLTGVMRGIEDLAKGVFGLLAGPVETDANMIADEGVKKEEDNAKVEEVKKEEDKAKVKEEKLPPPDTTAKQDMKLENAKIEKGKSSGGEEVEKLRMDLGTASAASSSPFTNYRQPTVADLSEDGIEGIAHIEAEMLRMASGHEGLDQGHSVSERTD